jgi:NADH dehydrogenase
MAVGDADARRAIAGLAMGLTAIALIYSPWGKQSGAHMNPAVTLTFLRLGKIRARDAFFYIGAQFVGGAAGVAVVALVARSWIADPSVAFVATVPGAGGARGLAVAFAGELAISALLMTVVLRVAPSRFGRWTGLCAGVLVALFITFEAPLSGMSMNPARTIGSAIFAGAWSGIWIYFTAPIVGMLVAAEIHARSATAPRVGCPKLHHDNAQRCIFCGAGMRPVARKQRVVILGGGFGGVYTAQALERSLGKRDDYEIVLVNKENYFVFQPMLPEVISGTIGLLDTVSPIRRILPKTDLHVRGVEAIDVVKKTVTLAPGFLPHAHEIHFDHLVLALGTVTDFRGLKGLPEHAMPFKNLDDALRVRSHVIRALEEAAIESDNAALRKQLLTFVVAGGGFSGVEVVAELNDFVRHVAKNYRGLDPREIRVVLVHSQGRILPEVAEKLAAFAQRILASRGVELKLNARLAAATAEEAILADGTRIPTRTLISTIPSSPHPLLEALNVPKTKNGRINVTRELEVTGAPGIWALGDCANIPTKDGGISPPTAQHASRQGDTLAHNIVASIRGGARRTFDFGGLGKMGSLGRRSAVAEIFGLHVSGFLAWFLWRTIYLMKLPGFGRRAKVAASWTFDLILPPELVQLRVGKGEVIAREHFEPGQVVFHEGDLGDRVYMILSGRAEVVRGETILARLGAGEQFGEIALLDATTRGATVRCAEAMDVLSLPAREFALLAEHLPELRRSFERVRDARVHAASSHAAAAS